MVSRDDTEISREAIVKRYKRSVINLFFTRSDTIEPLAIVVSGIRSGNSPIPHRTQRFRHPGVNDTQIDMDE